VTRVYCTCVRQWHSDYQNNHADTRGSQFKKQNFKFDEKKNRLVLKPCNYIQMVIFSARRDGLMFMGPSLVTLVSWALELGNYELGTDFVQGRSGTMNDRRRLEALAAINLNPTVRGADKRLVELVVCGSASPSSAGFTLDDVMFRPPFQQAIGDVEVRFPSS